MKIMLIDPSAEARLRVHRMFSRQGQDVVQSDLQQAVCGETFVPDFIVVDPGDKATAKVVAMLRRRYPAAPILVVSARPDILSCRAIPNVSCLTKPHHTDELEMLWRNIIVGDFGDPDARSS